MYKYLITYHCEIFNNERIESGESNNAFDVLKRYWQIKEHNKVLSVDVEGFEPNNFKFEG